MVKGPKASGAVGKRGRCSQRKLRQDSASPRRREERGTPPPPNGTLREDMDECRIIAERMDAMGRAPLETYGLDEFQKSLSASLAVVMQQIMAFSTELVGLRADLEEALECGEI